MAPQSETAYLSDAQPETETLNSASSAEYDDVVLDLSTVVLKDEDATGRLDPPANRINGDAISGPPAGLFKSESAYYEGKSMVKDATLMDDIPREREITLTFTNICSWVPNLLFGQAKRAAKKSASEGNGEPPAKRQILFEVSGAARPREVLALMGPSGSGKTSLISVLGNRANSNITTDGEMLFNNRPPVKSMKRKMGFVLQDDLLYPDLTVYETLLFAALLRLPRKMPKEEKAQRVEKVIQALGLERCRNTIIGGFMRRGVSGGERKRVSVGHELLINPSILFLDEPTSGLDSTTALALVSTLHTLAQGGRTIITTIHQPSSRMFQKLEKLMLLSEGRVLYYGYNANCVDWFKGLDAPCPFGINVADFILDLATGNQGKTKEEGQAIRATQANAFEKLAKYETFDVLFGVTAEHVPLAPLIKEELEAEGNTTQMQQGKAAVSKHHSLLKSLSLVSSKSSMDEKDLGNSQGAAWPTQFAVLFNRAVKVRRFESLSIQRIAQVAGVSLVAGLFYFQRATGNTVLAARDTVGLLFFETLYTAFTAMFQALFVFPNDMRMVVKERQSGMYRLSAFYLARTMSDVPMDCLIPTFFITVVYFMGGLRLSAAAFFCNWIAVIMSLLTAQSVGLLLGAGVTNVKTAQTMASILILTLMLSGGFYVAYVPPWISWVKYLSMISYCYNILLHIEFNGVTLYSCPTGPDSCIPVDSQEALSSPKHPNDPVYFDAGIMLLMLFATRFAVYWILNRKTKMKRS